MALVFPSNPSTGDRFPDPPIIGAAVWTYDGEKWKISGDLGVTYGRKDGRLEPVVPLEGGELTSRVWITSGWPQVVLNRAALGGPSQLAGRTQNVDRWRIVLGNALAEEGASSGSHFTLQRFNDAGTYVDNPLYIDRPSGNTTIYDVVMSTNSPRLNLQKTHQTFHNLLYGTSDQLSRWHMYFGDAAWEPGGNVGTYFVIARHADNGAEIDFPIQINRTEGRAFFSRPVVTSVTDNFAVNVTRFAEPAPGTFYAHILSNNNTGAVCYIYALSQPANSWGRLDFYLGGSGFFLHNDGMAVSPAGGPWLDIHSDARVKNVKRNYVSGLTQIKQLKSFVYTFKGNDTEEQPSDAQAPYSSSRHYRQAIKRTKNIGLTAQDVENIMPELVSTLPGQIDGKRTDVRQIDTSPLVYALINAVKELSARVKALEERKRGKNGSDH